MKRQRVGVACDKCRDLKAKVRLSSFLLSRFDNLIILLGGHSVTGGNRCVAGARATGLTAPGPPEGGEGPGLVQQVRPSCFPTAGIIVLLFPEAHRCRNTCQHTQKR